MTLKQYILHQLREMQREMATALTGLTQDQLQTCPTGQNLHIAWMAQHCCANVDIWLHRAITGNFAISHSDRFINWPPPPPGESEPFPDAQTLLDRWMRVSEAAISAIESLDEEDLHKPGQTINQEPLVESCLRAINHQNAHLRQIWMILGHLGLSEERWPAQGAWLAHNEPSG